MRPALSLSALLVVILSTGIAQAQLAPLPENTIPCEAFKRSPDGVWRVEEAVTFDVGSTKAMRLQRRMSNPKTTTGSNIQKDPEDWVSGDDPMTGAQGSYLKT